MSFCKIKGYRRRLREDFDEILSRHHGALRDGGRSDGPQASVGGVLEDWEAEAKSTAPISEVMLSGFGCSNPYRVPFEAQHRSVCRPSPRPGNACQWPCLF